MNLFFKQNALKHVSSFKLKLIFSCISLPGQFHCAFCIVEALRKSPQFQNFRVLERGEEGRQSIVASLLFLSEREFDIWSFYFDDEHELGGFSKLADKTSSRS